MIRDVHHMNIEIHLTHHCNLNCRYCTHWAPIAEKWYLDPKEYEENLKTINPIFFDIPQAVRLMGGEPLLNKNINEIISITRKYFKNNDITIFTNGILLPKMNQEFFDTCITNNVSIYISLYNKQFSKEFYDNIIEHCNNHLFTNICIHPYEEDQQWIRYTFDSKYKEHYNKVQIFRRYMFKCNDVGAWHCQQLVGNRLYICTKGAYGHIPNKKFGTNIEDNEWFDLTKDFNEQEMKQWYNTPKEICGVCILEKRDDNAEYGLSTKQFDEWFE